MSNAERNKAFLSVSDQETRDAILSNVADHYGITQADALAELTSTGAEHLIDYLSGSIQMATYVLMNSLGLIAT